MKKTTDISQKVTLGFSILSFAGFIYNLFFYISLEIITIKFGNIASFIDRAEIFVGIIFIILFLFHISAILTIIFQLKASSRENLFTAFLFFISIISLIMVFGDFALISDIIKEYKAGISGIETEFIVLYFSQALHLLLLIIIPVFLILKNKRKIFIADIKEVAIKDEAIFINVQYIGIFTGTLGLIILTALSVFAPLWAIKKGIVTVCATLILPYAIIAAYWLIMKFRERLTEWYDEKQFQDVTKASLISFISSMVILAIFFIIQNTVTKFQLLNVIWFPLYFFIALVIFSGTILYLNKKALD
ncbi:MAG: hypothetical protein M1475_00105 [Actinobacteria bacterium]|nr:hypothetical protein [Actinomycetota bacterium]